MLTLLAFFSSLVYGGDVLELSNPYFQDREAASRRLKEAGWLAYPAIQSGGNSPESAARCEMLTERLENELASWLRFQWAGRTAIESDVEISDKLLIAIRGQIGRYAELHGKDSYHLITYKCEEKDVNKGYVKFFISTMPWTVDGTEAGEVRWLLDDLREQYRNKKCGGK